MPRLIDTHCHLQFIKSTEERTAILERMEKDDIWAIAVGTGAATSAEAIELARAEPRIWATVGYHPEHLTSSYEDAFEGEVEKYDHKRISELAKSSDRVVAIGETGLDFYRIDPDRNRADAEALQTRVFIDHLNLAHELNLPIVFHCRDAFPQLTAIIENFTEKNGPLRGVVHCFVGSWTEAQPLLDLGLYLSFTGIITFPHKKTATYEPAYNEVIRRMPLDRIMLDTDAPWLAPVPHRGKQNEPSFARYIAEKIAELRGVSTEEITRITTENAIKLFKFPSTPLRD